MAPVASPPRDDAATLSLIGRLSDLLRERAVEYCLWKGSADLALCLQGGKDLDLLVAGRSVADFVKVLKECGFKEARKPGRTEPPGVTHFYGFDAGTGRIVHVHVYYRLLIGNEYSGYHHLPVEEDYLAAAVDGDVLRKPAVEFEFILFVLRMVLRYASWETLIAGHGPLPEERRRELGRLQQATDKDIVGKILARSLPRVSVQTFESCLEAILPGCPARKRVAAAHGLLEALSPYRLHSRLSDVFSTVWRRYYPALKARAGREESGRLLVPHGSFIAIVGGDGSGKTTCVRSLEKWLEPVFAVRRLHLGKPPWSALSVCINGLLAVGRNLRLYPYVRAEMEYRDENPPAFPGYPWLIRETLTARDRYRAYRNARRFAESGGLVVADRFPLPHLQLMDRPAEKILSHFERRPLVRFLGRHQKRYYERISSPDLVIVLRVPPDVAVARKTDEDAVSVRARSNEIWEADWAGAGVHLVDAALPKEEVLRMVQQTVWSQL